MDLVVTAVKNKKDEESWLGSPSNPWKSFSSSLISYAELKDCPMDAMFQLRSRNIVKRAPNRQISLFLFEKSNIKQIFLHLMI